MNSNKGNVSKQAMLNSLIFKPIIAVTFLWPLSGFADVLMPPDFTVEYSLKKDNTEVGVMSRTLMRLENGRFKFESSSKTTGFISLFYQNSVNESTSWYIRDEQFIADQYHYLRIKKSKQRKVDIHFNWDSEKIITSVNESTWSMPIQQPVYDKLLYQIALMYDLSTDRPVYTYHIADGGRMKEYQFETVDNEIITTPIGDLEAVKLIRHKDNRQKKTILWCAPKLHYLPIRVDNYEDDGNMITALIKSIDGLNFNTAD